MIYDDLIGVCGSKHPYMGLSVRKGFQKQMQKPTDCRGFELTLLCRLLLAQEKQVLTLLRKQVMSPNRASRR